MRWRYTKASSADSRPIAPSVARQRGSVAARSAPTAASTSPRPGRARPYKRRSGRDPHPKTPAKRRRGWRRARSCQRTSGAGSERFRASRIARPAHAGSSRAAKTPGRRSRAGTRSPRFRRRRPGPRCPCRRSRRAPRWAQGQTVARRAERPPPPGSGREGRSAPPRPAPIRRGFRRESYPAPVHGRLQGHGRFCLDPPQAPSRRPPPTANGRNGVRATSRPFRTGGHPQAIPPLVVKEASIISRFRVGASVKEVSTIRVYDGVPARDTTVARPWRSDRLRLDPAMRSGDGRYTRRLGHAHETRLAGAARRGADRAGR